MRVCICVFACAQRSMSEYPLSSLKEKEGCRVCFHIKSRTKVLPVGIDSSLPSTIIQKL